MDNYGQRGEYVHAGFAAELEIELKEAYELIKRLEAELDCFDCDDTGQDLKEEVRDLLENK